MNRGHPGLLTEEEIQLAYESVFRGPVSPTRGQGKRAIVDAAVRKLVEWIEAQGQYFVLATGERAFWTIPTNDWQALREAVGLDKEVL